MRNLVIKIFLITSFFASCNKDNSILSGENCRCWNFYVLNSKSIKPIHGICFKTDNTAYKFVDNYEDSIRYITDLVADANPGGFDNIFFEWQVVTRKNMIKINGAEYTLLALTPDSIVYRSKVGLLYNLKPATEGFNENWDIQYDDDNSVHNEPM